MSRRKRNRNSALKTAALAVTTFIGVAVMGAVTYQSMQAPVADALGCYDSLPSAGETVMLIDTSEPRWNQEQQRSLRHQLDEVFATLPFNRRLTVYTNEGDKATSILKPSFSICGVGQSPHELTEHGLADVSAGFLKKRRESVYQKNVKPYFDKVLALQATDSQYQNSQSPLLEMLRELSKTKLDAGDRLVFITDGTQFTESAMFCRTFNDMPPFAAFKKRNVYRNRLTPDTLEGVDVNVLMLQRIGYGRSWLLHCEEDELATFWMDYFKDNGVYDPDLTRIRLGMVSR